VAQSGDVDAVGELLAPAADALSELSAGPLPALSQRDDCWPQFKGWHLGRESA